MVELVPGDNLRDPEILNRFENSRVIASRRPGRGPSHGIEEIRVDHARFLYKDDEANPENKRIIGMYIMGTITRIFSGAHIDRANRTTSPERFRPGMQVSYNSDDYKFSVDNNNPYFNDIRGDGEASPENVIPEGVVQVYGIKKRKSKRKTANKRKTAKRKSKKSKRKTKPKRKSKRKQKTKRR